MGAIASRELKIHLWDLIRSLAKAVDLISPVVANHHMHVAYIVLSMASELGLSIEEKRKLVIAGALHDVGALSLTDRLDTLQFELEAPHKHSQAGYKLLGSFPQLSEVAIIVRHHHVSWNDGSGARFLNKSVQMNSHLLHISDRVDVLIDKDREILGQANDIYKTISDQSNKMFVPEFVEVFERLVEREYFWLEIMDPSIDQIISRSLDLGTIELDVAGLTDLARLFSLIIDFRSRFTSTHSSGVSSIAETLARLVGYSQRECQLIKIAGYLHDMGKLAVPTEILEKPGKLTEDEFRVIKSHAFHSHNILAALEEIKDIAEFASFHHERLDGRGYPFHLTGDRMTLGCKIMAVADVFSALIEDRSYRKGMSPDKALQIINKMVDDSALDRNIVSQLESNINEVASACLTAQSSAAQQYKDFAEALN